MELQEVRKKKEALEAMQKTQERRERNIRRSRELSSTFMQEGLLKKMQSVENVENRTNVASVEGSSHAGDKASPKPAIKVNVNSQTQSPSPQATQGSMSKHLSKVEKASEVKSKGSGDDLRKFSATHNNQSGSPPHKSKHLSMGLNHHIGMSIQVNKTFQHHAGTT